MAGVRLTFEERNSILKWYIKFENVAEFQRQWKREFQTQPPTRLTITRLRDKFDSHGTICDVRRGRSVRPRTATSPASSAMVWERFKTSPKNSATQCARETVVSSTSVRRILKAVKWKVYIPRLLHAVNDDAPYRRMQFCAWIQQMVNEDKEFVTKIVWCDEDQFKLNGTVNRHNCVNWAPENLHVHVDKAVNLPGMNVWCELSAGGLIEPFFFEGTVTGEAYVEMLSSSILPAIRALYENSEIFYQKDGAPPHNHGDVRAFLDENLQGHWIGRRGTFEFPPRSPDLTPLDFNLWGTLKDVVYRRKPVTPRDFRAEIRAACAAVPINTLTEVAESTARHCNRCLAANAKQFEHLINCTGTGNFYYALLQLLLCCILTCIVLYCNLHCALL